MGEGKEITTSHDIYGEWEDRKWKPRVGEGLVDIVRGMCVLSKGWEKE